MPSGPILGGPWDLATTSNWAYSPSCNAPKWVYRGYPMISRAITPDFKKYLLSPINRQVPASESAVTGSVTNRSGHPWCLGFRV